MCCEWERGLGQCLGLLPPVLPSVTSLPGRDRSPQRVVGLLEGLRVAEAVEHPPRLNKLTKPQ